MPRKVRLNMVTLILYQAEILAWETAIQAGASRRVPAMRAPSNAAAPEPAEAPRAKNPHLMARPGVGCTVAYPLARGLWKARRASRLRTDGLI